MDFLRLAARTHGVWLEFIHPGKPTQYVFVESLDGTFRAECLNGRWFDSLYNAPRTIEAWCIDYDHQCERPHSRLRDFTPAPVSLLSRSHTTPSVSPSTGPTSSSVRGWRTRHVLVQSVKA